MKRVALLSTVTLCLMCAITTSVFAQMDAENLLTKMVEANGGKDRLSEISTSVMVGTVIFVSQGDASGDLKITNSYPSMICNEMKFSDGTSITQGYDGNMAWLDYPAAGGLQELFDDDRENMRRSALGINAYLNPEDYGIKYTYRGKDTDTPK